MTNLSAKVTKLTFATSGTPQSFTGVGFQPKAFVNFGCQKNADGSDTGGGDGHFGGGTGASNEGGIAWSTDGSGTSSNAGRHASNTIGIDVLSGGGPTIDMQADLASFDSDGASFNVTDLPAATNDVFALWLGGTDLGNVAQGTVTPAAQDATVTATPGFEAKAIILYTSIGTGSNADINNSIGFATSTSNQMYASFFDNDASANMASACGILTDNTRCLRVFSTAGAADFALELTSITSTQFVLTTRSAAGSGTVYWIALGGANLNAKVVTDTVKTSSTGTKATTGVGFQPDAILLVGTDQTADGTTTPADSVGDGFSIGAASSTSDRAAIATSQDDSNATGSGRKRQAGSKCYSLISGTGPTVEAEADLSSFDSDGFTLNYSTVPASSAYKFIALALAGTASGTVYQKTGASVLT